MKASAIFVVALTLLFVAGCAADRSEEVERIVSGDQEPDLSRGCYTTAVSGSWVECSSGYFMAGLKQLVDPAGHVFVAEIKCCPRSRATNAEGGEEQNAAGGE